MDAARLDAEARLRIEVRRVLADLHLYGIPRSMCRGKSLAELYELRRAAARNLMRAPKAA